jgi:glycosyltransferase involved in cell wall biosynthesis
VKLAVVVQRYGSAINGGAELHARYIAEHLAKHAVVEVLTTCAVDYITWRNELPPGRDEVNGIPVRRFCVKHERNPEVFGGLQANVFEAPHSIADELAWLDAEGPTSTDLVAFIRKHAADYDFLLFFSYRYYHAYHGVYAARSRALLVPTAERDDAIGLSIFPPLFRSARAVMYNSPEERLMIGAVSANEQVPGVVVGVGSDVPQNPQPARFRSKFNVRGPFAVYVGRIDRNKGCEELFGYFQEYLKLPYGRLSLVLVGNSVLDVPRDPRIRHLGFLEDTDKFDAMAAADLLVMPSYYESLSMVALEAWALGKPVLANGRCDVLKGQCVRSNAGLYYESLPEFIETLTAMERQRWLNASLGRNGRQFFRENYDWPIIERKYLDTFERLQAAPAAAAPEPLPGWLRRHRDRVPAAKEVLARLPVGPAAAARRDARAGVTPRRTA